MRSSKNEGNPFDDFVWSIGEEGSDPIVTLDGTDFRHDQFAQSGHYEHLEADLQTIAALGVKVVRYGTPWRLAEPEAGVFDWRHWDRAFAACDAAGLEPVVEFLHFGLPDRYSGFVDGSWVDGFCRYVDTFIDRYNEPRFFTPVNEPGITALLSARLGLWNDRVANPEAHATALGNVVLANLEAMARLRGDRDAWWVGSEGFDMPIALVAADEAAATARRDLHWLVWDLHFGIDPPPAAGAYLAPLSDGTRDRIASLAITDKLIAGLDIYPSSIRAMGAEQPAWTVAERMTTVLDEIRRWHARYQKPFWIAETSNLSLPVADQIPWLDAFATGLANLRTDGVPARGICWYSRGDQFDWHTALTNPTGAVTEVGLFDVKRNPRPVADRFRQLAAQSGEN